MSIAPVAHATIIWCLLFTRGGVYSDLGGCDQWGRFEYYYGDDDSTNSRDPVTIFGQGNCPVEVIDAFNYTPIDYLLQVNKQTRSVLLFLVC